MCAIYANQRAIRLGMRVGVDVTRKDVAVFELHFSLLVTSSFARGYDNEVVLKWAGKKGDELNAWGSELEDTR